MGIRTSDGAQHPQLMQAVGWVMQGSAHVSDMAQQIASTVTGSQLVPFLFDDKTLGVQLDQAMALVRATNWNPYAPHPPIEDDDRLLLLDVLAECKDMVKLRNRVAHDSWTVFPTDDIPDRVEARRPARWARAHIVSSITALRILGSHLSLGASAMSTIKQTIVASRKEPGGQIHGKGTPERFLAACAERREGKLDGWLWEDVPWAHTPRRDNPAVSE